MYAGGALVTAATRDALLALADRVEAATPEEAERTELGVEINEALEIASYITDDGDPALSVDGAIATAPPGAGLNLDRYWIREGVRWKCELSTGGVPEQPRRVFDCWDAYSPALAISAAALRARAAMMGEG